MKRTVYEAPVTELFRVELEGNFCASADVENTEDNQGKVGISDHEIGSNFGEESFGGDWE